VRASLDSCRQTKFRGQPHGAVKDHALESRLENLICRTLTAVGTHGLPEPWIRLVRVEGLNNPRVFDPGGCFSKRYYHQMLFGACSKYHPQHLPDRAVCRFSTFRLSLPCGRRLLKNHWNSRSTGHHMDIRRTSTGHQMDTKWICFLAGHGVCAFASINLLPLECRMEKLRQHTMAFPLADTTARSTCHFLAHGRLNRAGH
jgi:hypothetical protein